MGERKDFTPMAVCEGRSGSQFDWPNSAACGCAWKIVCGKALQPAR